MDIPNSPLRSAQSVDDQAQGSVVDKLEAMVGGAHADVKSAGV